MNQQRLLILHPVLIVLDPKPRGALVAPAVLQALIPVRHVFQKRAHRNDDAIGDLVEDLGDLIGGLLGEGAGLGRASLVGLVDARAHDMPQSRSPSTKPFA